MGFFLAELREFFRREEERKRQKIYAELPKEPPLIAPGMPDYDQFCRGYWRECERCEEYVENSTGLFCMAWERVYPGAVRWYYLH